MGSIDAGELPHNLEAEQGLLGMLMVNNRDFDKIADIISPVHFSHPTHGRIFESIGKMITGGGEARATTLCDFFKDDESLNEVGGTKYLVELATEVPLLNDIREYARTIVDRAQRRNLIAAATQMIRDAQTYDIDMPATAIIEQAEAQLFQMAEKTVSGEEAVALSSLMSATYNLIERAQKGEFVGVPTGIAALDEKLGGFRPDEMTILAGRPGMGKTALALTIAKNAAMQGHGVLFNSLEMGGPQLVQRLLASETNISTGLQLRAQGMREDGFQKLISAGGRLSSLPLWVDQSGTISAAQIRARARRMKRRHPNLSLLIVDYLGLVKSADSRAQRVHQLGEVSKMMKATAKDLHIHVILLAQVNRGVEGRENKRCSLSDLRDSGEIEEDADLVMFPYREEYYLKDSRPHKKVGETTEKFNDRVQQWDEMADAARGRAEISIGKFRQGTPGTIDCGFDGTKQIFHDL